MAIEVEKKFILNNEDIGRLLENAEFVNEKIFTDIYYDNENYSLTSNDIWLRKREGKFEMKIPISKSVGNYFINKYEEIEGEENIRKILKIEKENSFINDILEYGFKSFCECKSTRKKYRKGEFVIDLDEVEYENFNYKICEIELLVEKRTHIEEATKKILQFAKENNLRIESVRGKVIEYLKREKPQHYQVLVNKKVVIE